MVASQPRTRRPSSTGKRAQGKKFECTHPGCKKRFTRMEHMQRHALNHAAVDSTCPRCLAVFKRADLLGRAILSIQAVFLWAPLTRHVERHIHRHQQRDAEAGGPGHGILDTRKRAWKGPDGSVVDKRPRTDTVSTTRPPSQPGLETSGQVVSPPVSDEGIYSNAYSFGGEIDDGQVIFGEGFDVPSSLSHNVAPAYFSHSQYDQFPLPPMSSSKPQPTYRDESIDYHPAFQPDTASSFNMPYTTALDYNWLFNLDTAPASGFDFHSGGEVHGPLAAFPEDVSLVPNNSIPSIHASPLPTPQTQTTSWPSSINHTPQRDTPSTTPTVSPTCASTENPPKSRHMRDASSNNMVEGGAKTTGRSRGEVVGNLEDQEYNASPSGSRVDQRPLKPENPLSMLLPPSSMPQMDQETRERLLRVIETASPRLPDQLSDSELRDHPLLSLASLQTWLDLFFTQFNTTYPLIHMSTFKPPSAEPLLLLSMILLGATYSDKPAHQIAVCIHDVIRPSIFSHAGFSPSPELWALQTILLVECFGKSRAGQKQHDMSHLFHGLLINLIRRSDCQSISKMPSPPSADDDTAALAVAWGKWAVAEQKKRLALLCFMWDTQHAVLFCQSLCMSAFELRCTMPCDQNVWEAPDAVRWAASWRETSFSSTPAKATGPLFLTTLKSYLTPAPRPAGHLTCAPNILSLVLVLHGIMSISWDMQRRDQTSLGVSSTLGVSSWRHMLGRAYDAWKVDFDQYCHAATAGSEEATCPAEWSSFHAAYSAIYHAAQTLLHIDFLDVQIYAGARNILGRPVQQRDYQRSSKIVKRWAMVDRGRAAIAAYHAAAMLNTVVVGKTRSQTEVPEPETASAATDTNLFHVPWCLYLATLTCWAFHHAKPSRRDRHEGSRGRREDDTDLSGDESDASDDIVWDSHKEMEALVKDMAGSGDADAAVKTVLAGQGRKGTNGLVWVVADVLSKVRWGIVHAGVIVLRGLVPGRLVNQYASV